MSFGMKFGTWLHTLLRGKKVGEDAFGNTYYTSGRKRPNGYEERWVVYKGEPEASKVPAEWHAWLHNTTDDPIASPERPWIKPHLPNLTGTDLAYQPPRHEQTGGPRAVATADYQARKPE